MSDDSLPPGSTLGAFLLESRVGRGGMGDVYRARNRITGETRAVKVVRPEHLANDDLRSRFVREMRLAASVEHPNVVRVYEPSMEGDTFILPMEFIEGITLREHLRTSGGTPRRLPADEALELMVPVCEGVGALHVRGIVHRDLKPLNVMLVRGPHGALVPKVLDLGAALDLSGSDEATRAGLVVGTVAYMPFEQAAGRRDLDARVDVYALGVILYEMLTGRRPYDGADSQSVLANVIQRQPFPGLRALAPEVEAAIGNLVDRALSHDREARPADARALADALRALQRAAHATDTATLEADSAQLIVEHSAPPPVRSSRTAVIGVGALVVVTITLVVAAVLRGPSAPPTASGRGAPRATASAVPPPERPPVPAIVATPVVQLLVPVPAEISPGSSSTSAPPTAVRVVRSRVRTAPVTPRCRPRPGVICPPTIGF